MKVIYCSESSFVRRRWFGLLFLLLIICEIVMRVSGSLGTTNSTACSYGGYKSTSTSSCTYSSDVEASCTYMSLQASSVCQSSGDVNGASCSVSSSCVYSAQQTAGADIYCCSKYNYINYNGVIFSTIDQATGPYTTGTRCTTSATALPSGFELARDVINTQNAIAAYPFGTSQLITASGNAYYSGTNSGLGGIDMLVTSGTSSYSSVACSALILIQQTSAVSYGLTYSTLLGVQYNGATVYGQTTATPLPSGWALADFSTTTLTLACKYPWSTQYMIFSNGWYVATNNSANSGSVCRVFPTTSTFTSSSSGYTPTISNAQMLIYWQPTSQPTTMPSSRPSSKPSRQPSSHPSNQPTGQPTRQPTSQPTRQPYSSPTGQPTRQPTSQPTTQPTMQPTSQPTKGPTSQPSARPTRQPTYQMLVDECIPQVL
jgi:hypothetical protein